MVICVTTISIGFIRQPERHRAANPFSPQFLGHRGSQCGKMRPVVQPKDHSFQNLMRRLIPMWPGEVCFEPHKSIYRLSSSRVRDPDRGLSWWVRCDPPSPRPKLAARTTRSEKARRWPKSPPASTAIRRSGLSSSMPIRIASAPMSPCSFRDLRSGCLA